MKRFFTLPLFVLLSLVAIAQEYAIINVSVCNTRSSADYDSPQESQALLGMPAVVLENEREWTKIRTPEDYEHWVLSSCIHKVNREQLSVWNKSQQVVVTSLSGYVFEEPSRKSQKVSDVVAGNRLHMIAKNGHFYKVMYPDGRIGFLPTQDAKPIWEWRYKLQQDAWGFIDTALDMNGVPYMWGGTSPKGVDCSGLIRTVLYMHDIIMPRNASQMAKVGQRINIAYGFTNILPGDLLFFGRKTDNGNEIVSHVGMYIGLGRFIHSLGSVHVSSLISTDPLFDEYNLGRLLFASRIIPYINRDSRIITTDNSPYYQ